VTSTPAFIANDPTSPLVPTTIERRPVGPSDVRIDIEFCGICHSDVHTARNEWGSTTYPVVPGHEIAGRVAEVGSEVRRFTVGDRVGVGCMVDSCRECDECRAGLEQYCSQGMTGTYNAVDKVSGGRTMGGYSSAIVVDERYVVRVPDSLDLAAAAPILCAGITMFSPLRHYGVKAGSDVAVVGLGGLGGMAVKLAKAMGANVTVITRSDRKADDAKRIGADAVLVSTDPEQLKTARKSFDLILSTIPVDHDLMPYLPLIKRDGAYVILGAIAPLTSPLHTRTLLPRVSVTGSMIGGMPETQEVLDFCAEHGITADIEIISADEINQAYDRLASGDPGYRFVIDASTFGAS
jgi:uncharacterized zinc-type alcohol dehydrogenase-like protein